MRRFSLPAASTQPQATLPVARRREFQLRGTVRGSAANDLAYHEAKQARIPTQIKRSPRIAQYQISSPYQPRRDREQLRIRLSDDTWLPSAIGRIRLSHTPEAVDLSRLTLGQMMLHRSHLTDTPIGKVLGAELVGNALYISAELAATKDGIDALEQVNEGVLIGASPGFIIHQLQPLKPGESGYSDERIDMTITRHEIYEASLTSIPRNSSAKLIGRNSMVNTEEIRNPIELAGPQLVNPDDMDGLSLVAGRMALNSGQIPEGRRREKLSVFFAEFDRRIGMGESRAFAVEMGKNAAGMV